jgi:1L-myo-inositol 1-phosphate cytidylyltransferase
VLKARAQITDCLIVAAGKGTRLKGFGDLKPLVNLCGRPLIEHAMRSAADAGVTNFVIVTGYKSGILKKFLQSLRKKYRWKITIVENPEFEKANGLSVLAAKLYLKSDFFLSMCDHVVEPKIYDALMAADLTPGTVGLGVDKRLKNPDVDIKDVTRVVAGADGKIEKIGKDVKKYNAFDCGIFRANPSLFAAIEKSVTDTGDCSISGGMKILSEAGQAQTIDIGSARWIDVDSPQMHKIAHKWMRSVQDAAHNNGSVVNGANLNGRKIVAVGHRGSKKFAPENTLAAHEAAFALGARAIEFDVRCTKDGHFVLMHDANVNRTTNGFGRVKKMSLDDVKSLDAGSWKGSEFTGESVPTLREALRNVKGRFVVDIDFKGGPRNSAQILSNLLEEEGFSSGHLVTIFARRHHFGLLKSLSPQYALRPHYISARRTKWLAREHSLEIMGLRRLSFSFKAAKAITSSDFHLFCNVMGFSDNERGFEDSIKAGALFIQTDHLDRLIPFLESRNLLQNDVLGRDYQPSALLDLGDPDLV